MAVRPTLSRTREDGLWSFSFPYDLSTITFLKHSGRARWDATGQTWVIEGEKEAVLALLEDAAIPERYIAVRGEGGAVQGAAATGGWTPYLVGADDEDTETERVALMVGGALSPRGGLSSGAALSAEEQARYDWLKAALKRKRGDGPGSEREREDENENENEKATPSTDKPKALEAIWEGIQRKKAIQRAFYEPMALLPVEESVIEDLAVRHALMPHQNDGVRHFLARTCALNGDDMGLGKTRQTVSAASHLAGGKIIVCPASLKDNWSREIRMVFPEAVPFIFENGLPDTQPEWLIVNYERLAALLGLLDIDHDWIFVVATFDEAHYLKEPSAQRTKAALDLAARAKRKWLLTATPMLNKPEETWTLLRLSGHPVGDLDLKRFTEHFAKSRNDRKGLGDRIAEWMIRRLKDDVLTLEGKYRQEPVFSVSDEDRNRYAGIMDDEALIPLQKINLARQWLEQVKRGPILELMNDLQPDAKAIVFCNFTATADWFVNQLPKGSTARITGAVPRKRRDQAVQRFQTDPACRWFVGNIDAAGVGLNLTAATYVFFVSRPWTPAKLEQAEDRAYRIGQGHRVEICTPTITDTLDEQIKALLANKQEITGDVLAGALEAGKRKREDAACEDQAA